MSKNESHKNLIPLNRRTKEEQRRIAISGGKKSGEVRRYNKTFKQALSWYLDMERPVTDKTEDALLAKFPNLTNRDAMAIAAVEAATKNKDVRAMVFVRDTIGEIPVQSVNIAQEKPFEIIIKTLD